jgi:hypothetical protein
MNHPARCVAARFLTSFLYSLKQRRHFTICLVPSFGANSKRHLVSPLERVFCFRLWPQRDAESANAATQKKRTLFTDAYFGLDQLARHNNKQMLRVASPESFKARLRADFAKHGVRNIFIMDLELFLAVSENAADMELSRQLFVALLQEWIALFFNGK